MTRSHLAACPSCGRHVRISEAACPFCVTALSAAFQATPLPQGPGTRLARAALFAFGAGTLAMTPACSSSSSTAPTDAGEDVGTAQPSYGASAYDAGLPSDGSIEDVATSQPVYGAPADAGEPVVDSGKDAGGPLGDDAGAVAAYGGPPIVDGG